MAFDNTTGSDHNDRHDNWSPYDWVMWLSPGLAAWMVENTNLNRPAIQQPVQVDMQEFERRFADSVADAVAAAERRQHGALLQLQAAMQAELREGLSTVQSETATAMDTIRGEVYAELHSVKAEVAKMQGAVMKLNVDVASEAERRMDDVVRLNIIMLATVAS